MQIHLVIAGLIWPGASAFSPVAGLELPALARLLGAGQRRTTPFEPLDRQLARAFDHPLPQAKDGTLPLAALRHMGESATAIAQRHGIWLCADPVNLSFAREHLLLNDFPIDELDDAEIGALLDSLNENFGELGHFEAGAGNRWYLQLGSSTSARFYPLHDVVGRPIKHFLPEGTDGRRWQHHMNDIQVMLHNHPVNQAREARGQRTVNSLWFWGAGALPPVLHCPADAVQTRDPLAAGFARAAGIEPTPPDCSRALAGHTLVVLDTLLKPALQLDLDGWRSGLETLERDWFAPLWATHRSGRLRRLTVTAPGDRDTLTLSLSDADRWKFWRRPLPFERVLQSLAPTATTPESAAPSTP